MSSSSEELIRALCTSECSGRRTGTPGGRAARKLVRAALEKAGLRVEEQPIASIGGANLVAEIDGAGALSDRFIVVGAHYDHLGVGSRGEVYHGADDNAAAVGVLVETARRLAEEKTTGPRRRVVVVAFDAEEPPYFSSPEMGSEVFAESDRVPLDKVDLMVAMDLVGHAVGPDALPLEVQRSLFVLGAEKCVDLEPLVSSPEGLFVRRLDAEVIPPLSDYEPFWRREKPFLFLTCGRSRVYHTPEDTPEKLDFEKIDLTAEWLARVVSAIASQKRPFFKARRDDLVTSNTVLELARVLGPFSPQAGMAALVAEQLVDAARKRDLDATERATIKTLIAGLESALG